MARRLREKLQASRRTRARIFSAQGMAVIALSPHRLQRFVRLLMSVAVATVYTLSLYGVHVASPAYSQSMVLGQCELPGFQQVGGRSVLVSSSLELDALALNQFNVEADFQLPDSLLQDIFNPDNGSQITTLVNYDGTRILVTAQPWTRRAGGFHVSGVVANAPQLMPTGDAIGALQLVPSSATGAWKVQSCVAVLPNPTPYVPSGAAASGTLLGRCIFNGTTPGVGKPGILANRFDVFQLSADEVDIEADFPVIGQPTFLPHWFDPGNGTQITNVVGPDGTSAPVSAQPWSRRAGGFHVSGIIANASSYIPSTASFSAVQLVLSYSTPPAGTLPLKTCLAVIRLPSTASAAMVSTPTNAMLASNDTGSLTLTWDFDGPNPSSFVIFDTGFEAPMATVAGDSRNYTWQIPNPNQQYCVSIAAVTDAGQSSRSNPVCFAPGSN